MKRNLIIGGVALALLLISIKFFPYHCNCQARNVPAADTGAPLTATSSSSAQGTATPTSTSPAVTDTTPRVVIGQDVIKVDVADTEALREQGLSGRAALCDHCGMLFVFPAPARPGFWMKDMNFSLDIVWISPDKKVIGVEKNLAPSTYPTPYYPSAPVAYVLEMPAGSFDAHGLRIGDAVSIDL